ncbi:N-acetylmuramoyl-L-alanine amidase AmiD [Alphaproteobacteria bacterium SO-S41]|nr:N-acetylmuramoyl-L-alanine amidase AmiD [Alphaproteobacteria bacterium SO-S41]
MTLKIVALPSPNFNERPGPVDMLVLHYTGMPSAKGALDILTDGTREKRVSAHYTLDRDGTFYAHVPEDMRAWHAGVSWWGGRDDVNSRSIGIEIVNPGHEWGYRDFPKKQIDALIAMCRGILRRHPIPARNVVGHSDIAPGRKVDPGEKFPWPRLARNGIGLFPRAGVAAVQEGAVAETLRAIGYGVAPETDKLVEVVLKEFQRRFRVAQIDGVADEETRRMLAAVAAAIHPSSSS